MQHIASSDVPALALDDILHTMSPSPTPQPQPLPPEPSTSTLSEHHFSFDANANVPITHYATHIPRTSSPEPLDYSELEAMRARVQECALSHSAREAEFAAMVLRLASHLLLHPSPAQLASQAEAIADLTFQRNMLLHERAEELDRWQAERYMWDRTADALASKARATHDPKSRDPETQRYVARLEDDLKMTRRRLADAQSRFSTLERELSRLRPLLSLHATIIRDPQLWRPEHHPPIPVERHGRDVHEVGQVLHEATSTAKTGAEPHGDGSAHTSHPSQALHVPSSKTVKRSSRKEREKDRDKPRKHRHRHSLAAAHPLLADARSEFIMVAARKLGRLRAGILSGFVKEQAKLDHETELLVPTTQTSAHERLSPATSRPHPTVSGGTAVSDDRATFEGDVRSSSPPVPLAASRQRQGSGSKTAQRRLAPSPFAPGPGAAAARPSHMPTHLHPSAQAYPIVAQGRHPHAMPHPGFVYFASGPGQSGTLPFVVPVPWAVPGTPPGSRSGQVHQTQGQAMPAPVAASKTKTPARTQAAGTADGSSTPMDSLVSAARTLIEDEDYDGDSAEAGGSGTVAVPTETGETAEEDVVEETPVRRRGTRRRAVAAAPESPAPKRRRTANTELTAPSTTGPDAKKSVRKTKAAALSSQIQEKPKAHGRVKGKGKQKVSTLQTEHLSPSSSTSAPPLIPQKPLPHAPQVARIRSALDVLADQAAQEQERWPSLDATSRRDSESEGREEESGPAAECPTTPAPDTVVDDLFAPAGPPEPALDVERELAVESPETDTTPLNDKLAAHDDADGRDADSGEAELIQAIDVPDASRISESDHTPALEAAPRQTSPPPPISSPRRPPQLAPSVALHQAPSGSPSPCATSEAAQEASCSVDACAGLQGPGPADEADVRPPLIDSRDAPGSAPAALEIESSDEDAEGSIVEVEMD